MKISSFGMKRGNKTFLDEEDSSFHQQTCEGTNGAECCKQKEYEKGRSLGTSGRRVNMGKCDSPFSLEVP